MVLAPPTSEAATDAIRALRDDGTLESALAEPPPAELAVALFELGRQATALRERLGALRGEDHVTSAAPVIPAASEAAALGATAAMEEEDWIFPGAHELSVALWRRVPLPVCAAWALRGERRADAHSWKGTAIVPGSALSGRHVPHAAGLAWAARLRRQRSVALALLDLADTSSGDFHTGLNFAGVARAPLIAVCVVAAGATPSARHTASAGVAVKALAYGLRGIRVDGTDAVAVLGVVREARAFAAAGNGGTLVEAVVPARPEDPPFAPLRRHLESRGLWDPEREHSFSAELSAAIDRATDETDASSVEGGAFFDHVFAQPPWHLQEQRARSGSR